MRDQLWAGTIPPASPYVYAPNRERSIVHLAGRLPSPLWGVRRACGRSVNEALERFTGLYVVEKHVRSDDERRVKRQNGRID